MTLLMLVMSVVVLMVERAGSANEPVAESEHTAGECLSGHDHTICTQVGANLSALTAGHVRELPATVLSVALPTHVPEARSSIFEVGHPSRAPPLG
jgi:hypothetical protein